MSDGEEASAGGQERSSADDQVAFDDLPAAVRTRVLSFAARAIGTVPTSDLPPPLRGVARFTPAKRARLAARALTTAIRADHGFRAMVAQQAAGSNGATEADPVAIAARAYLLHLPGLSDAVTAAAELSDAGALRAQVDDLTRTTQRLTARAARLTAERDEARRAQAESVPGAGQELDRLRGRLREQGSRLSAIEREAAASREQANQHSTEAAVALARAVKDAEMHRQRADRATAKAEQAHQLLDRHRASESAGRAASDRRIDLLLTALEQGAAGLRREWRLSSGGADPADVVAASMPRAADRTQRAADPGLLGAWLSLPGAHLIVDGYNVTKTGYPDLSLADQRDRLVRALGALAARTSAEVTVVFDGAAVTVAAPPARGIRVLFSPAGVIADEVIRQLVRAEPVGRTIVVVSSDREVVDGVRRHGARTAPSAVLLGILG